MVLCLAIIYLGFSAWCLATTRNWINRPFPGFLVTKNNYVSLFLMSDWEGSKAGIKARDLVLEVEGKKISSAQELDEIVLSAQTGATLNYKIDRKGRMIELAIPVSIFGFSDYLIIFPVIMLIGLFLYGMGLAVFFLKPNLPASRAFLVLGLLLGITDVATGEYSTNHVNLIPLISYALVGPAVFLVSMYFPVVVRARKYFIFFLILTTLPVVLGLAYSYQKPEYYHTVNSIMLLDSLITRLLGLGIMIVSFVRSQDPLVRQKGKVVIYAFLLAFLVIGGIVFEYIVLHKRVNLLWTLLPWIIIPLGLGYAIAKHNLFDVDVFIRRSLSYILVSGIVIAVFLGLLTLISLGLQQFTGQSSQIATVISTLMIAMVFRPLQTRIDGALDRRFFRARYEYTATIRRASGILVSIIELEQLLRQLLATVVDAVKIERGAVFIRQKEQGLFLPVVSAGYRDADKLEPFNPEHPLIKSLESSARPLQKNDFEELEEFRHSREPLLAMMSASGLVLTVPILYERRLIGLLGLGEKKSGAWYSSEDMELLQTLMMQTAVSIENARKVEELKKMVGLEASYRELERMDKLKDNFLSMVSHDLRTPMTSIKGYAAILLEKLATLDDDRHKRYLSIIINESDRLTRLISDLLDLQRFEAGKMALSRQELDIVRLAKDAVDSFSGAAISRKQILEHSLPDRPVMVRADRDRIFQALANLLSNATKFTPESGRILVSVGVVSEGGKNMVRVSVRDSGPGIAGEMQEKLFNKFQQVENAVKSKEQGSGLGLALVREIIEHHEGRAGVESEAGAGSNFFFTLPVAGGEA